MLMEPGKGCQRLIQGLAELLVPGSFLIECSFFPRPVRSLRQSHARSPNLEYLVSCSLVEWLLVGAPRLGRR